MNPELLAPLIPIAAIIAIAAVKIAKVRATTTASLPADVNARLENLEGTVHDLQDQLAETQERLDFAERLLTRPKDEP
jgi:hypothetical protein